MSDVSTAVPATGRSNGTPGAATPSSDRIRAAFDAQKAHAPVVRQSGPAQRISKIDRIRQGVRARRQEIRDALYADFRKAAPEVDLTEVKSVADEATFAIDHLEAWMQPERVKTPPLLLGTTSEIHYQPKGVTLIISPWNYPINLTLSPLIAALAAGNTAIIKPSEFTPHASAVMRDMIAELFDPREVTLFEGDKEVAQELLALPFDHIYFTGSPQVGKIVMRAAAEHLTPVTLELGGKSPTIVDDTADLDDAATKIAWGKFTNAGQTCIAPDHVYVHERVHDELVERIRRAVYRFYGATDANRRSTPDYARLVNDRHFERVRRILSDSVDGGATLAAGGQVDASTRYVAPTLLTDVPRDTPAMQEEIFGPVLPILSFRSLEAVLDDVNARPNPLALYLFTQNDDVVDRVLSRTSAGGTCVNDVLLHYMNPHLPFGGAGHSGIGKGHGKYAFQEFSHARSVLRRSLGSRLMRQVYPPYGPVTKKMVDWVMRLF